MYQYALLFVWGLLALCSFAGWGVVANRLAGRPAGNESDFGLFAGWGMALSLAVGGVASLLGVATAGFAISHVLAGAAIYVVAWMRHRFPAEFFLSPRFLVACVAAVFVLIRYAAWVHAVDRDCNDDDIAYFAFVARLLDTGTLIEPFSLRRLAAGYGGQTFLQSLIVAVGSETNAMLMDRGIAVAVCFGLVLGLFPSRRPVHYAFALILTVVVPFPVLNSTSHITGLAMFLTLFRTFLIVDDPAEADPRHLWLSGMVMAGTASLRPHFGFVVAVMAIGYWFFRYRQRPSEVSSYLISLLRSGLASSLFLAPWMALSYVSSGSALYPLFKGNHRPDIDYFHASVDTSTVVASITEFLTSPEMLFFVPLAFVAQFRKHGAVLAFYAGAFVGTVTVLVTFTNADTMNVARYVHPFVAAAFIVAMTGLLSVVRGEGAGDDDGGPSPARVGDAVLIGIAVLLAPYVAAKDLGRIHHAWGKTLIEADQRAAYVSLQAVIPDGQRVLIMTDQPFAFDYARHDILNIDAPGIVSPDPGMPFFQGPEALSDYLRSQSIRYVAFKDFDRTIGCGYSRYNRAMWNYHKTGPNRLWRMQSAYYLDMMDNLTAMAGSERILFEGNGLTAIELR